MSLSMYDVTVPVFTRMLENTGRILGLAQAYAEARKIEPSVFVQSRLAPDMLPLSGQIQIATDQVKGCVSRLAGVDVPAYADTETTFLALQERIARTLAHLATFTPEALNGSEGRAIVLNLRGNAFSFSGQTYVLNFVYPNFYFHVTTAYAILRHNGVEIGKLDYMGR